MPGGLWRYDNNNFFFYLVCNCPFFCIAILLAIFRDVQLILIYLLAICLSIFDLRVQYIY